MSSMAALLLLGVETRKSVLRVGMRTAANDEQRTVTHRKPEKRATVYGSLLTVQGVLKSDTSGEEWGIDGACCSGGDA